MTVTFGNNIRGDPNGDSCCSYQCKVLMAAIFGNNIRGDPMGILVCDISVRSQWQ